MRLQPGLAVIGGLVDVDIIRDPDPFRRLAVDRLHRLRQRKLAKALAGNIDDRLD